MAAIAITGGIAEGKSTVLGVLAELGFRTTSADAIARDVFQEREDEIARVFELTPPIDRTELHRRIAREPADRRRLNAIMHPAIVERLDAIPADFVEVPLLVETVLVRRFRAVWVVTCGPEEQLRRLVNRVNDESLARQFLATQLPTRAKIPFADFVVNTNQPMDSVRLDLRLRIGGG